MLGVLLAEIRQELQDKTRHHNNVRNTDSNSKKDTLTDADDSIKNTQTYDMISEFDANETLNNNDNTITCDPDDDLTSSHTSSLDINSVITATTSDNTSSDRSRRIHRTPAIGDGSQTALHHRHATTVRQRVIHVRHLKRTKIRSMNSCVNENNQPLRLILKKQKHTGKTMVKTIRSLQVTPDRELSLWIYGRISTLYVCIIHTDYDSGY